ncbi:MAG: efflux RND transporter periplasmic adaptor subunit [Hyphomicrobiaceae bacterium]|nr:efflux RND transporter periplasmic adaptor subunit [Hyphomicrobiaceae bacterium]
MGTRTTLAIGGLLAMLAYVLVPQVSGRPWDTIIADTERAVRDVTSSSARPPQTADSRSQTSANAAPPAGAPPPPQLTVSQPIRRDITDTIIATGRFDAMETVELRSRVSGYLNEVRFKDGQDVAKGDLLFVIDPRPAERVLAQAKAELAQAKTRIDNASLDVERARSLVQRKIVSEKTFDDRENLVREAEAQAKIAEERIRSAELELSYTRITAPISGRIGRTLVTPGNFVSASGSNASSSSLATIVVQDPIHLYFEITEADALRFKRMATKLGVSTALTAANVDVQLADETEFKHRGSLDFLDNRLDVGTASLRVRAVLSNRAQLFTPGQFARVRINASEPYTAFLVPDTAIGTDQTNRFVITVGPNDTAVRKPVTLGQLVDGLRVVRTGLTADDWIVTRGLTRVRPGQKMIPLRETLQISSGTPQVTAPVTR